jgi:hypothetical protein
MTATRKRLSHLRVAFLFVRQKGLRLLRETWKIAFIDNEGGVRAMNEQDAIEFASINGVTVTTDKVDRFKVGGKWSRRISFRVGKFIVIRFGDETAWRIAGVSPRPFRRGEAIERCVNLTIEQIQMEDE